MKLRAIVLVAAQAPAMLCAHGQTVQPLDAKISAILNRPKFRRALFGIEVYSYGKAFRLAGREGSGVCIFEQSRREA